MRLACAQTNIVWENKEANFKAVRKLVASARLPKDTLLLLPEMFASGFSMDIPKIAEEPGGESERFLCALAKEFQIFILAGVVMKGRGGRGRNEALLCAPKKQHGLDGLSNEAAQTARYRKVQPFTLGGEGKHYERGKRLAMFGWRGVPVAPRICYDLRFPEVFRAGVHRGAQVFAVIANWPIVRDDHWVTLLRARAIENQCYVAGANRCGTDPQHVYSGRSIIVDMHGKVLADAGDKECIISSEIDLDALRKWREDFPVLKDRRFDL